LRRERCRALRRVDGVRSSVLVCGACVSARAVTTSRLRSSVRCTRECPQTPRPACSAALRTSISATMRLWCLERDQRLLCLARSGRGAPRPQRVRGVECTRSRPRALTCSRVVRLGARACAYGSECGDCVWMAAAAKRARTQRAGCDGLWVAPWQRTRARAAHPPLALPASRTKLRVPGPHNRTASPCRAGHAADACDTRRRSAARRRVSHNMHAPWRDPCML
jgi:hypothetical protein